MTMIVLIALAAGCDMALICNDRLGAIHILDGLRHSADPVAQMRLARSVSLSPARITTWTKRVQGLDPVTDVPNGLGLPNATVTVTPTVASNTALIEIQWRHPRQLIGSESRLQTEVLLTTEEVL